MNGALPNAWTFVGDPKLVQPEAQVDIQQPDLWQPHSIDLLQLSLPIPLQAIESCEARSDAQRCPTVALSTRLRRAACFASAAWAENLGKFIIVIHVDGQGDQRASLEVRRAKASLVHKARPESGSARGRLNSHDCRAKA